jgi:hypothetical protein
VTDTARTRDRLAAAFILAAMALGCVALFVGVPLGVLWGLSNVTNSLVVHFVLGLVAIPLVIVALSPGLFWVNGLYLRVTEPREPPEGYADWEEPPPRRGPLEGMLVVAFAVAIVALAVWFLFFAENPVLTA